MSGQLHYRVRFRDLYNTTDVLVVSSVPTDDNPYLVSPPRGDGTSINPLTGKLGIGAYVIEIADEVGTVNTPTLEFDEQWNYADQAARNLVWAKTSDQAAAFEGGDQGGFGGDALHVGVTYGGGLGGGGGFAQHEVTITGLTPGATYTVVCDRMTLSRELGPLDDCGISVNDGEGETPANGALDGPVIVTGVANGSGELEVKCGHFDLEFGMTGIVMTFGRIRVYGPGSELETRVVTGWLADDDARWQVGLVRAFVEESTDGGETWTTLLGGYVDEVVLTGGIQYDVRIGESDRRERRVRVFEREEGDLYATRLVGAPTAFGPIEAAPYDYWVMKVRDTGDTASDLPDDAVVLEIVRGWMYEHRGGLFESDFDGVLEKFGEIANETRERINRIAPRYADTSGDLIVFTGLDIRVEDEDGDFVGSFHPYGYSGQLGPSSEAHISVGRGELLIVADRKIALKWSGTLPANDTIYRITGSPSLISEDNPLHFEGHPVDLVTMLYDAKAVAYDATSAATVKAALGNMKVRYRWTEGEVLQDAIERCCFGPFGFAVRPTVTGEWEFFTTRTIPSSEPDTTITSADIHDPTGSTFRLTSDSITNRVRFETKLWTVWTEETGGEQPADGIVEGDAVTIVEPDQSDVSDLGPREIVYSLPGDLLVYGTKSDRFRTQQWMTETGGDILQRWGRGCAEADLRVLRGVADAKIGEFVVVDVDHKPAASTTLSPTSQRGVSRIAQVVHRTETPAGPDLTVLDFGPNESVDSLVPTFTLAQGDDTRHVATYAITNSGDLSGYLVRVEMATGSSEPTGSGVLVHVVAPTADETDLPGVENGSTVWVRMRVELADGGIPGDWSSWDSVALDALPAVTSLANAAGANDTERLITWTVGDANLRVRVRWKLTADSAYTSSVTLAAGSVQYTVTGLTPGSGYTVAVDHLDAPPYVGDGPDETTSWTAGSTMPTLTAPSDPAGHTDGAGVYGIDVTAYQPEMPSRVEVEIAVETSAGSGTYGSYATDGSVESVSPGRTRYSTSAPNDGLKRKLKARHTKTGYTESAYTTEVTVDPWGEVDQPPDSAGSLQQVAYEWCLTDSRIGSFTRIVDVPAAATEINVAGTNWRDWWVLQGVKSGRIILNLDVAGPTGTQVKVRYSLTNGATFVDTGIVLAVDGATGPIKSDWLSIASEALTGDVMLSVFTEGGDGASDLRIGECRVQFAAFGSQVSPPPDNDTEYDSSELIHEYRADTGVTEAAGAVSAQEDLVGTADRTAGEGGPTLVTQSSESALYFSGGGYLQNAASTHTGRTAGHLFLVIEKVNQEDAASDAGLMNMGDGGSGNPLYGWVFNHQASVDYGTDDFNISWFDLTGLDLTLKHILEIECDDDDYIVRINGVEVTNTANGSVAWPTTLLMGVSEPVSNINGNFYHFHEMEFSARQSSVNAALIRQALYTLHGITP